MNIFISGGAKNGKSFFAQKKTKEMSEREDLPLYYVATMIPVDEEDHERIKRHIKEREGWGFTTVEKPYSLSEYLNEDEDRLRGVFLVDSVTAILANEMFKDGEFHESAPHKVAEDLREFAARTGNVVFVSDYIYNDYPKNVRLKDALDSAGLEKIEFDVLDEKDSVDLNETGSSGLDEVDYTEEYRKGLAYVDRKLVEVCDSVIEITAGLPIVHK